MPASRPALEYQPTRPHLQERFHWHQVLALFPFALFLFFCLLLCPLPSVLLTLSVCFADLPSLSLCLALPICLSCSPESPVLPSHAFPSSEWLCSWPWSSLTASAVPPPPPPLPPPHPLPTPSHNPFPPPPFPLSVPAHFLHPDLPVCATSSCPFITHSSPAAPIPLYFSNASL